MDTNMTIEQFIKEKIKDICDKVYIAPNIPDKKLNGGIIGITADEVDPDYVIAIADTTIFGSAKEGCLFTGEEIYIKGVLRDRAFFKLSDIQSSQYKVEEIVKDNGKTITKKSLTILMKNNEEHEISNYLTGINIKELANMLNEITKMADKGFELKNTNQSVPISMMDPEIKKTYLKLLRNFAYSNDNMIDSQEYAEIISLMVRIELSSEDRIELRGYMFNNEFLISDEELLNIMKVNLHPSHYKAIKLSLMKDILCINRRTNTDNQWKNNKYILELQEKLEIGDNQIDAIEEAIINDEDILNERKNDSEIEKSIKDVASKTAAVGVPLAAIYLSGSVVGVSAAGITSGLATLGMGGLLGFSSMFTGIGVAVLIGMGTYQGLKKITGIGELENSKQRELMLQEIIINSQKSLNIMIEDINTISYKLIEAIKIQKETDIKIAKLTEYLGMLTQGARIQSNQIDYAEREKIIARLPEKLDINRLVELTNTPTTKKYMDIILSCYIERYEVDRNGNEREVYELDDKIATEDLRNLSKIFHSIGYNKLADASVASIKSGTKKIMNNIFGDPNG